MSISPSRIQLSLLGLALFVWRFYMLYRPGTTPHVFGEVPSKSAVVAAVRQAGAARAPRAAI